MTDAPTPAENRGARRRARTRSLLVDAACALFAEQGVDRTRIQEITERADVGFGSFYNHFSDKDAIVTEVLRAITEQQGERLDALTAEIEDPAEVIAVSHREFVRLAEADATWGWLVVRLDASYSALRAALGSRALRDLQRGIEAGRLDVPDTAAALQIGGAALVGTIRGVLDGILGADADVRHAELVLRMLGLPPADAAEVAARPLPASPPSPASAGPPSSTA